jgi:hypothetical protein
LATTAGVVTTTVMSATEAEASPGGGLPVYNVKADFAGTPVSAGASRTDNTTAINNAAAAASAGGGGIVYLSEGDWGVATSPGVVMRSNVYFMLAAGCRVFPDFHDFDRGLFRCGDASNVGSVNQTLSADATTGATTLTVSPLATVAPGFYILGSNADVTAYAIQPVLAGEYVEVVSATGGVVTLRSGVRDNYLTTDGASLRGPITFVENFGFFGPGEIINPTPGAASGKSRFIEVNFGRNFSIEGLVTRFQDRAAVSLLHCRDSRITGYKSYDGANDDSNNLYGYALLIEGCSENVLVDDCHFARVRDGTTTGDGATAPANPCPVGLPRNILITNCTHHQPKLAGFGTHAAGDGIVYQSCKVSGYYDSGDPGQGGFVIQGARTDIIDCEVTDYVGNGIHLVAANGSKIRGARIRHITRKAAGTHGTGIFIAASGVLVEDVEIDTVDSNGIMFSPSGNGPPAGVTVDRVRIKNANGAADTSGNGFHGILLNVAGAEDIAISDVYVENTDATFRGYRAGAATDGVRILNASLAGPVHVDRVRTKGVAGQAVNDVGTRPAGSRRNNNYKLDDPASLYLAADQVAFTPGNGITATNVQDALSQAGAVSSSSAASGHYGDGSDGPGNITGTSTLARDWFYDTLVVHAGATLITNGFRILARTSVTIEASAIVRNNGAAASGATAGAPGPAGSLGGGGAGGAGGKSGVSGTAGAAGTATSPSLGGNGGSSGGTGGGAGGVATPPSASRGSVRRLPLSIDGRVGGVGGSEFLQGGAGGRGANGGALAAGGGGGGGGGVVVIATPALQLDGEIQANGGAGGSVSGGNGGGGGGGGTILLTYRTRAGAGTTKVLGGAGSNGGGGGGSAGNVIEVVD